MEQLRVKCDRLEEQRSNLSQELEQCEERLHAEKRQKEEVSKGMKDLIWDVYFILKLLFLSKNATVRSFIRLEKL
jgi:hypothetical protein